MRSSSTKTTVIFESAKWLLYNAAFSLGLDPMPFYFIFFFPQIDLNFDGFRDEDDHDHDHPAKCGHDDHVGRSHNDHTYNGDHVDNDDFQDVRG